LDSLRACFQPRSNPPASVSAAPNLGLNAREHVACLTTIFDNPRRSTRRFVEQVSFLPDGGQSWTRSLQIQIPPNISPRGQSWRVVSLGPFTRRRLADLTVQDASDKRVSLLTRHEHGAVLLGVICSKHFRGLDAQLYSLQQDSTSLACETYHKLLHDLYEQLTTVDDLPNLRYTVKHLTSLYECLLGYLAPASQDAGKRVEAFQANVEGICTNTRYLCWVSALPGEIVHLRATYTTIDTWQRAEWREGKDTHASDSGRVVGRFLTWFREVGLAPLRYGFLSRSHTNSYYFTLEPPGQTEITYFDWVTGNTLQNGQGELDSALASAHYHYAHNSSPTDPEVSPEMLVYLRSMTHGHKQIVLGAALNIAFVLLLARGHFSSLVGGSVQTWLLVTPSVLTAYIAERQRHYYAYATRRQRGVLWIYLVVSLNFLVAISFYLAHESPDNGHWGDYVNGSADVLLVGSVLLFGWYSLLGYTFHAVTRHFTKRLLNQRSNFLQLIDVSYRNAIAARLARSSDIYDAVVARYCATVFCFTVLLFVGMSIALVHWWGIFPQGSTKTTTAQGAHVLYRQGEIRLTTWSSSRCQGEGCSFDLRFVPSKHP
jgi:hypothetical protein